LLHVEDPFVRQVNTGKIAACGMDDALRFPGGAAGIKEKKNVLAIHLFRLAPQRCAGHELMPPLGSAGSALCTGSVPESLVDHNVFNRWIVSQRFVRVAL